jgi:hypothetical protein
MNVANPAVSEPTAASPKLGIHQAGTFSKRLPQAIPAATVSKMPPTNMRVMGCRASRVSIEYHNLETWA